MLQLLLKEVQLEISYQRHIHVFLLQIFPSGTKSIPRELGYFLCTDGWLHELFICVLSSHLPIIEQLKYLTDEASFFRQLGTNSFIQVDIAFNFPPRFIVAFIKRHTTSHG